MRIVFISDTHGQHQKLQLPVGDMIIHAGDISKIGLLEEVTDFLNWFKNLDFKYKIFVAGNHDFSFEKEKEESIQQLIPENIIYLNDSEIIVEGIKIWGSPITPWFFDWAFNRQRGKDIQQHWDLIPEDTDILVTHGPPYQILDQTNRGESVGCVDLLKKIKKTATKIHVFGHIHEAYGQKEIDGVRYINASVLNLKYRLVNQPVVLDFEKM